MQFLALLVAALPLLASARPIAVGDNLDVLVDHIGNKGHVDVLNRGEKDGISVLDNLDVDVKNILSHPDVNILDRREGIPVLEAADAEAKILRDRLAYLNKVDFKIPVDVNPVKDLSARDVIGPLDNGVDVDIPVNVEVKDIQILRARDEAGLSSRFNSKVPIDVQVKSNNVDVKVPVDVNAKDIQILRVRDELNAFIKFFEDFEADLELN